MSSPPKNATRPLAIIGDVHGEAGRLSALIRELAGRQLVFVGDYVNRGTKTRETLDELIMLKGRDREAVFLLGNHDAAFLEFLAGALPFYYFAGLGGLPTIRAYLPRAREDVRAELVEVVPEAHRSFLKRCDEYFETPDLIVSHCGIDPVNPGSRERADMVMNRHEGLFAPDFESPKLVVCGHYAQESGVPYVRNQVVCVDTGCGTFAGPLTALLLPERKFLQR
jgi:serine/threonine protein phosphatase 1